MNFTPSEYTYDRIYEAQPLKGVCLFGGNFEPRDYSMVYCGAYFHNLYRLEKKGEGYEGVLQRDPGVGEGEQRVEVGLLVLAPPEQRV